MVGVFNTGVGAGGSWLNIGWDLARRQQQQWMRYGQGSAGKARGGDSGRQGSRELKKKVSCIITFSDYFL